MKRKRKGTCTSPLLDESPKRTKVHAQRKFAQGSNVNSPVITPIKELESEIPQIDVLPEPVELLPIKRPNTEDFLTFLCFRGTPILPPSLNFFNTASIVDNNGQVHEIKSESSPRNGPIDIAKCGPSSEKPFIAFGVRKRADPIVISRQMDRKRRHALAIQALRRKYQEQKMAKIRALTISKLSEKVTNRTLVRTNTISKTETVTKKNNMLQKTKVVATKHVKVTTQTLKTTLRPKIKPKMCLRSFRGRFVQKELPFRKRIMEKKMLNKPIRKVETKRKKVRSDSESGDEKQGNPVKLVKPKLAKKANVTSTESSPRLTRSCLSNSVMNVRRKQIKKRILITNSAPVIIKPRLLRSTTLKKTILSQKKSRSFKTKKKLKAQHKGRRTIQANSAPIEVTKRSQEKQEIKKSFDEKKINERDLGRKTGTKKQVTKSLDVKKDIKKSFDVKKESPRLLERNKKIVNKSFDIKKEFTKSSNVKKATNKLVEIKRSSKMSNVLQKKDINLSKTIRKDIHGKSDDMGKNSKNGSCERVKKDVINITESHKKVTKDNKKETSFKETLVSTKDNEKMKIIKSSEKSSVDKIKKELNNIKKEVKNCFENVLNNESVESDPQTKRKCNYVKTKGKKEEVNIKREDPPKKKTVEKLESEKLSPKMTQRPSRKTKEAAAIYMEILSHKLVDDKPDDDNVSIDSFPELPNVKKTEQRENELKAQAKSTKDDTKEKLPLNKIEENSESHVDINFDTISKSNEANDEKCNIKPQIAGLIFDDLKSKREIEAIQMVKDKSDDITLEDLIDTPINKCENEVKQIESILENPDGDHKMEDIHKVPGIEIQREEVSVVEEDKCDKKIEILKAISHNIEMQEIKEKPNTSQSMDHSIKSIEDIPDDIKLKELKELKIEPLLTGKETNVKKSNDIQTKKKSEVQDDKKLVPIKVRTTRKSTERVKVVAEDEVPKRQTRNSTNVNKLKDSDDSDESFYIDIKVPRMKKITRSKINAKIAKNKETSLEGNTSKTVNTKETIIPEIEKNTKDSDKAIDSTKFKRIPIKIGKRVELDKQDDKPNDVTQKTENDPKLGTKKKEDKIKAVVKNMDAVPNIALENIDDENKLVGEKYEKKLSALIQNSIDISKTIVQKCDDKLNTTEEKYEDKLKAKIEKPEDESKTMNQKSDYNFNTSGPTFEDKSETTVQIDNKMSTTIQNSKSDLKNMVKKSVNESDTKGVISESEPNVLCLTLELKVKNAQKSENKLKSSNKAKMLPPKLDFSSDSDHSTTSDVNLQTLANKVKNKKFSKTKSMKKSDNAFSDSDEEPLSKLTSKSVDGSQGSVTAKKDTTQKETKPIKGVKIGIKSCEIECNKTESVKPKRECAKKPQNYLPMLSSSDEDEIFHGFDEKIKEKNKSGDPSCVHVPPLLDLLSKDLSRRFGKEKVNMSNEQIEKWLKDSAMAGSSIKKENDEMLKFGEIIPTETTLQTSEQVDTLKLKTSLLEDTLEDKVENKITESIVLCKSESLEKLIDSSKPQALDRKLIFRKSRQDSTKPNINAFSPENESSVYAFGEENEDIISTPFRRPSRRPSSTATSRSEDESSKHEDLSKSGHFRKPNVKQEYSKITKEESDANIDTDESSHQFYIPQTPCKPNISKCQQHSAKGKFIENKTLLKAVKNCDRLSESDDFKYKVPSSPSASSSSSAKLYKRQTQKQKCRIPDVIAPVYVSDFPKMNEPARLVEAPVFHPTDQEFQDPLEYIERIRHKAEQFGVCRIVPPSSFKPECKVTDDMRFTAYNQYIHKMMHRWGPNYKELTAIKKYLRTQNISLTHPPWIGGMEIDLPRLYQTVQTLGGLKEVIEKKKWPKVSEQMKIPKSAQDRVTKLDDIYCKYLLPYDTLSPAEREKLFDEVETDWAKRESKSLMKMQQKLVNTESITEPDSDTDDDVEECITKGRNMALNAFYRIARNTMSMHFKNPEPSAQEVEQEFWKHVTLRQNHICVHSGSIDSGSWGYGFAVSKNSPFARHPWNLKVLTNNSGSVLRSLGPVMGVTVPTLHVGMVFSACCWHRDPHGLPWIEYLHTGGGKVWYGVPEASANRFKAALQDLTPNWGSDKELWLPSDTWMVPPSRLLTAADGKGVSLCRTVQEPGQFIVVFPKVFTSSISTGYVVSESVYFAPSTWLKTARSQFDSLRNSSEPSMFSLDRLLLSVPSDLRCSPDTLRQVMPYVQELCNDEQARRKKLAELGDMEREKMPLPEVGGGRKGKKRRQQQGEEGDYECEVCRMNLFVSMVFDTQEGVTYCLDHAIEMINNKKSIPGNCKFMFTYEDDELAGFPDRIKTILDNKLQKKISNKYAGMPTLLTK